MPTFCEEDEAKTIVNNVASQSIVTSVLKFNPKATSIEARNSPDAQEQQQQQQLTQVKFEIYSKIFKKIFTTNIFDRYSILRRSFIQLVMLMGQCPYFMLIQIIQ